MGTTRVVQMFKKSTQFTNRYGYCTYSKGNPITGFWALSLVLVVVYHYWTDYWTLSRKFLGFKFKAPSLDVTELRRDY